MRHAGLGKRLGGEKAGVGALDETDAGIVAELHRDLAEAGIDGGDLSGAALEKAVSESAGGGANVEARASGDVNVPVIERSLKLETAAADVGHVFAEEADRGIGCDGGAGLVNFLFVDKDASSEDEGTGAFATGNEVAIDEQDIDAGFADGSQGFSSFSASGVMRDRFRLSCRQIRTICNELVARHPPIPVSMNKCPVFSGLQIEVPAKI